jgi:hypothetical protein
MCCDGRSRVSSIPSILARRFQNERRALLFMMPKEKNTVGLRRRILNGRQQFEVAPGRWVSSERVRQLRLNTLRCRKCRISPKIPGTDYCDLCTARLNAEMATAKRRRKRS